MESSNSANPYTIFDQRTIFQYFSWGRLILTGLVFVSAHLFQITHGVFLSPGVWQPLNIMMAVAFGFHVLLMEFYENTIRFRYTLVSTFVFDALAVLTFMVIVGYFHTVFLLLLCMILVAVAFVLGAQQVMTFSFFVMSAFNIVYALLLPEALQMSSTLWITCNITFFVVAFLSGELSSQLEAASTEMQSSQHEVERLTSINDVIVENIPSGILIIDKKYQILFANRGAAKIFSDLGLVGKNVINVFQPLKDVLDQISFEGAGKKSAAVSRHEIRLTSSRNEKLILETIVSKMVLKTGEVQILCLLQNVTEVKNLELAMRQKEKLAAVGALAAGIAHEIRNPLASISGSVQLLQAQVPTLTHDEQRLFSIMIKEIDRLNGLITEFLDYVRPEVRHEDPIEINRLIKDVVEVAKLNKSLTSKVEHRSELQAQSLILGHAEKLKQAFLNIVINAYQAMTDTLRPELHVKTYDSEGRVFVVFEDNGIGMSTDTQKRLFEPFHTTKPKGTGLGLAITHKILESHEAEIRIESELGRGTRFTISFPVHQTTNDDKGYLKRQA